MANAILGISAFYHDSAAALLIDGDIVAAAQEERFSRIKHDPAFPVQAIEYVLRQGAIDTSSLTAVAFYDKPLLKFERLLETYHAFAPRGLTSFIKAMPIWLGEKLFIQRILKKRIKQLNMADIPLLFPEHHLSHAASAFYPSPFDEAAILTIDGVGEWATTTICHGRRNGITVLCELDFPHSVGLLYSAFTAYLGFKVNSGEYKLMGLAPFGQPSSRQTLEFLEKIFSTLVDMRDDGSILLNLDYFNFTKGLTMASDKKWETLFKLPRRTPESQIGQAHMNFAWAAQSVLEDIVVALAGTAKRLTGSPNLVMAGGVALNCVANSKIASSGIFDNIWIQPAAGDAGGALGAAFAAFHIWGKNERKKTSGSDSMKNAYLGPEFSELDVRKMINKHNADFLYFEDFGSLSTLVCEKIANGEVVGWFQGRMEFGPRALGNRSILADPRNAELQRILNEKIKSREGFRPFAPSVLAEDVTNYFDTGNPSPYMLFINFIKKPLRIPEPENYLQMEMTERLCHKRSTVPAITHLDYSARIHSVDQAANPRLWQLLQDFKLKTNCGMLINTSFNVRGEPIVCTPEDAWHCFMQTEMDFLVIGNYLIRKKEQKKSYTGKVRFDPD